MFEILDGRLSDWYTISSPMSPGELKTLVIILILNLLIIVQLCFNFFMPAYFIKGFHSVYTCIQSSLFELVFCQSSLYA